MDDKNLNELKKDFDSIEVPPEIDLAIEKAIRKAKKENMAWKRVIPSVAAALLICSSVIAYKSKFFHNGFVSMADSTSGLEQQSENVAVLKKLPVLGSYDNLIKLLGNSSNYVPGSYRDIANEGVSVDKGIADSRTGGSPIYSSTSDGAAPKEGTMQQSGKNGDSYSSTNVQVDGVDEADEVKTDGQYIYKVNRGVLYIIKAYPKEELNVVNTIKLKDNTGTATLFLNGDKLVVISSYYNNYAYDGVIPKNAVSDSKAMPKYYQFQYTRLTVYDISDKKNPKDLREVEVEGNLNSARMIDNTVYMIGNKGIYYYGAKDGSKPDESTILPKYKDGEFTNGYKVIPFDKISYCPEALSPNFIVISSVDLKKLDEGIKVTSCVGAAQNLYMSEKNLYVSGIGSPSNVSLNTAQKKIQQGSTGKTTIYKFNLNDGTAKYESTGEVPGYLINQFSMDESDGYFRVATTKPDLNGNVNGISNGIYVLDKDMKAYGQLEGLAKGERIYSTRFMGNRLYMVTFKNTDPLFVIDMSEPQSPKVLGELKIPGFSNYLHPYDENHLIGLGMNTETKNIGGMDRVVQTGMKLALFDVSDVNNPKQQFETTIGDTGTYSEVLQNHKALLFSKEKGLLAFPVDVSEDHKNPNDTITSFQIFQGLYVYKLDLNNGFVLRGKITHINDKAGIYGPEGYEKRVDRALYINDVLYTFSQKYMKANDLNSLEEIKTLKLQ